MAGRAGDDAARVSTSTGGRQPKVGSGSSVLADYGLDDGSFAAAIHSVSSSLSWGYSYSCE